GVGFDRGRGKCRVEGGRLLGLLEGGLPIGRVVGGADYGGGQPCTSPGASKDSPVSGGVIGVGERSQRHGAEPEGQAGEARGRIVGVLGGDAVRQREARTPIGVVVDDGEGGRPLRDLRQAVGGGLG